MARDSSRPIFKRITLDGIKSHGFSLSDFSQPIVRGCVLMDIGGEPFSAFNGAEPRLLGNVIDVDLAPSESGQDRPVFAMFTAGNPEVLGTTYSSAEADIAKVTVRYQGIFGRDRFRRNILRREGCSFVPTYDPPTCTFFFGPGPLEQDEKLVLNGIPSADPSQNPDSVVWGAQIGRSTGSGSSKAQVETR
jgi:hypothetical protein